MDFYSKIYDGWLRTTGNWGLASILTDYQSLGMFDSAMWNANLMQQGNFINIFLARHVSGTYAHHQEH